MFTNTPDGYFVIDRHPHSNAVIVAAGFSGHGFKFCSVVGEILADLALDTRPSLNIDMFSWQRAALRK
jgi:sarcosine oxidase